MVEPKPQIEEELSLLQNENAENDTTSFTLLNNLTPFSRPFPPEIVDIIIEFLLDEIPIRWTTDDGLPVPETTSARLVCRAWNQQIVSNPALWTRFFFKLDAGKLDWLRTQTEMGELQMSRSGNLGLHLYIIGQRDALDTSVQIVQSFISFIQQHLHRWESITTAGWVFGWLFAPLLVGPDDGRDQRSPLRTLNDSHCRQIENNGSNPPESHFASLQSIRLCEPGNAVLSWNLPWTQLRDLSFTGKSSDLSQHLHILGQCVNLESLALKAEYCHEGIDRSPTQTSVVLPSLQSFKLSLEDSYQRYLLRYILPRLVFPRLQSLELYESRANDHPPPHGTALYVLCQMVENSRCNLQELQVYLHDDEDGSVHQEPGLIALLKRTQHTLRKLVVSSVGLGGAFLQDFDPERLEEFVVQEWLDASEAELTRSLVLWLRNQRQREGATERLQRMRTAFYHIDRELVPRDQWKKLFEEENPLPRVSTNNQW